MYNFIQQRTSYGILFALGTAIFMIAILNSLNISAWFSLVYVMFLVSLMWYLRYNNQYYLRLYGIIINIMICPALFIFALVICVGSLDILSNLLSFELIPNTASLIYYSSLIAVLILLIATLWICYDYKRWWSQVTPAWLVKNTEINGNELFIHYNPNAPAIGGWTAAVVSVFGLIFKGYENQPIGSYILIFLSLPLTLVIVWILAMQFNIYFQLRKIEKKCGARFLFWNMEKIQQERSKSWLGRLINPKLRPIYAELKKAEAQLAPKIVEHQRINHHQHVKNRSF